MTFIAYFRCIKWPIITISLQYIYISLWITIYKFLDSLKFIIYSSLLNFRFYVYVQELFSVSYYGTSYSFVAKHHTKFSLVLNLLFNTSMCCQCLVLFIRLQHSLVSVFILFKRMLQAVTKYLRLTLVFM